MEPLPPDARAGQLPDDVSGLSFDRPPSRTKRLLLQWGVMSWRLIGIGIVALACLLLLMRIRAVVTPLFVAVLLARALAPISVESTSPNVPVAWPTAACVCRSVSLASTAASDALTNTTNPSSL